MKITYLAHSGFFVETKSAYLLFDYFEGNIPERREEKPFYIFVSHSHADHFNPDIFQLEDAKLQFYLSHESERKVRQRHLLDYARAREEQITYVRFDETITDGPLYIRTLKSNDRGVAYLVEVDGERIYHAGDLNLWIKEDKEKAVNNSIKALFYREMEKIKGERIDVAFLPLDPTLGNHETDGVVAFCDYTDTKHIFPMHMWEQYDHIEALIQFALNSEIHRADRSGMQFEIL